MVGLRCCSTREALPTWWGEGAREDGKGERAGAVTYPQCSPHSMVSLEGGAPLLFFPTAAQLCPLQLLLQLGNLGAQREGEGRQVKQSKSAPGPSSQHGSCQRPMEMPKREMAVHLPSQATSVVFRTLTMGSSGKLGTVSTG